MPVEWDAPMPGRVVNAQEVNAAVARGRAALAREALVREALEREAANIAPQHVQAGQVFRRIGAGEWVLDNPVLNGGNIINMAPQEAHGEPDEGPEDPKEKDLQDFQERPELTRFYLDYDSVDEINHRLVASVFILGGKARYIIDAGKNKNGYYVYGRDENNSDKKFSWNKDNPLDFRSPEPRYIMDEGSPVYLHRVPWKGVYKQGMTHQNTRLFSPQRNSQYKKKDPMDIVRSLNNRAAQAIPYNETTRGMIRSGVISGVALSKNLCISGDCIWYKTRALGRLLNSDCELYDQEDKHVPWITNELSVLGNHGIRVV